MPQFAAYNVVGDHRTMAEAVAHLERRFPGAKGHSVATAGPPSGWGIRNDKLLDVIDFVPGTRLEDGIDRMLAQL
jgi:hypothetical protein